MVEEEKKESNSQDELGLAFEETFGGEEHKPSTPEEEKKEVKPKTPVPEDHPTKLGRRVSGLETTLAEMNQKLDTFFSRFEARNRRTIKEDQELPEIITTPEDVVKVNRFLKKQEEEEQEVYSRNYLNAFRSLGSRDPDLYPEIFNEMIKNFDIRHSDDSRNDARINYAEAKGAILSRKLTLTKPNVKNKKSEIPTDLGVESRETSSASEPIHLDDLSQEFVRSTRMKEESIKEALK